MNCSLKGSISQVGAVKQSTEVEPKGRMFQVVPTSLKTRIYLGRQKTVVTVVELEGKGEPADQENESGEPMKRLVVLVEEEGLAWVVVDF